jgi:lipopolysaccharide transport system ATP-binding protein
MGETAQAGRTVFFVSHNMTAVSSLCERAILLERGHITFNGNVRDGINRYIAQASIEQENKSIPDQIAALPSDPVFQLHDVRVWQDGSDSNRIVTHKPTLISIEYQVRKKIRGLRIGFDLRARDAALVVFRSFHDDVVHEDGEAMPGRYQCIATIPANSLAELAYQVDIAIGIHMVRWLVHEQVHFNLDVINLEGINAKYADQRPGVLMPDISWKTIACNTESLPGNT